MGKISPQETKITAIQNFRRPKTKKDVRAFLGLAGYYRRFIPNFCGTAAPLSDMTSAATPDPVDWTTECQTAFQTLKDALSTTLVLTPPDYSNKFLLLTDATEAWVLFWLRNMMTTPQTTQSPTSQGNSSLVNEDILPWRKKA